MSRKNRRTDETEAGFEETAPAVDEQQGEVTELEGSPPTEETAPAEAAESSAVPPATAPAAEPPPEEEEEEEKEKEKRAPAPWPPEVLDDRTERNLVVKALAKAAMAAGCRVGWLFHDEKPVLTLNTDEGPVGFHFTEEEREHFPSLPILEQPFDGADDRVRADRLERLVLK